MKVTKPILVAGAATTIGLAGITGLGVASAATNSTEGGSLVDKISTTFNLSEDEVKAVFDEHREEREAEHQQKIEDRLSELVSDGKLTEDQKSAILEKRAELKAAMEAEFATQEGGEVDPQAMKEKMQQQRKDLKIWAEDNDIPTKYLHFVMGGRHMHHDSGGPGDGPTLHHGDGTPKEVAN